MTSSIDNLESRLADRLHRPGTPGFDVACGGFDLSAIPNPDLVVSVVDEDEVQAAVRFAADRGMPIAVRATGHGPIDGVDGGLLIDTRMMTTTTVDPTRRIGTAAAGATWTPVLAKSALHGLIPVCGSSPDVGVVAYSLGGGLSPLGRRHGWAADRVRRIRLVTADGRARELTETAEPDLFWAVRGGGGNFGVVTEVEFDLFPGTALYAGGLYLPGSAAAELLAAFGQVTATAPDELSLSVAFLSFPDIDQLPASLRGQFIAHLRVTYLGNPEDAEKLIAPLRAVATPLLDTVRHLPINEFGTIHGDPTRPQPVSCGGAILPRWDDGAIAILLAEIGAGSPHMLELRQLGGALARPAAVADAVGHRDASYNIFTSAYPGPAFAHATELQTRMYERLAPFTGGRSIYNFTANPDGRPADAGNAFEPVTLTRLRQVKAAFDPDNLFRFNINVTAQPARD